MIFFSNPKVNSHKLLTPHYQETAKRIEKSQSKYILAIQDGMVLNFTQHAAKTELGRVGKAKNREQYGIIQHSTLCVTDKNEALGLIDVQHFDHDDFDYTQSRRLREIEEKKAAVGLMLYETCANGC